MVTDEALLGAYAQLAVANAVGNTALNQQKVLENLRYGRVRLEYGVDWGRFHFANLATFKDLEGILEFVVGRGDSWEYCYKSTVMGRSWQGFAKSALGGWAGWNELESGGYELMLSMSGAFLAGIGDLRCVMRVFSYLRDRGARATRIDIYADDYDGVFRELRPLIQSAVDEDKHQGFKDDGYQWSREDGVKCHTYNLGSRRSDYYHRIYDKPSEERGDRVRWELEIKHSRSHAMYELLCKAFDVKEESDFSILMSGMIRDVLFHTIDFIERSGTNLDRAERLDWWQDFITAVRAEPMKLAGVKVVRSIDKTIAWEESSVARSLAKTKLAMGAVQFWEWLNRLLDNGLDRLRTGDYAMIEAYQYDSAKGGLCYG